MQYIKDIIKRIDLLISMYIFSVLLLLISDVANFYIDAINISTLSNFYLPENYLKVYLSIIPAMLIRYIFLGNTNIIPDESE
tara:strand:- start:153 stop:398 length:246 start_codon:yes stop_codon:yes gene_type:complete